MVATSVVATPMLAAVPTAGAGATVLVCGVLLTRLTALEAAAAGPPSSTLLARLAAVAGLVPWLAAAWLAGVEEATEARPQTLPPPPASSSLVYPLA